MASTGFAQPQSATEEIRQRVIAALENPKFQWRTVDGIAKELGLPKATVQGTIDVLGELVIRSSVPDDHGRPLYTTRAHYKEYSSLANRILSAFSVTAK